MSAGAGSPAPWSLVEQVLVLMVDQSPLVGVAALAEALARLIGVYAVDDASIGGMVARLTPAIEDRARAIWLAKTPPAGAA